MAEAEDLMKSVQEMLKEETWTRAAISSYTKEKIIELASIVEKARSENCTAELQAICDEVLSNSKDSIIALYISGMISLQKGALDNSALVTLVDIFQKNHKEAIVEALCQNILEDDENNKFALRTLADFYKTADAGKIWPLYERLVKLDFEEADLAKALAEHYEAGGDIETATEYYKK
ncbi:MAG: transcription elongation factor GreA, partial [Treponemataceae bacterium]|nr:transcription elongation factor GreA [Treponemataceae bacterium]